MVSRIRVLSLLVLACNSSSAGAVCSSVITLQTESWRMRAACRTFHVTQLVSVSLGMAAALTDMVGKRVDKVGRGKEVMGSDGTLARP
jgi:hypothetical protein